MSARDESPHTLAESWCEVCRQFCYPPVEGAITNLCGCCDARVRADERKCLRAEGWVSPGDLSLIIEVQVAAAGERIAQEIEARTEVHSHLDVRCDFCTAFRSAAAIARGVVAPDTPTRDQ